MMIEIKPLLQSEINVASDLISKIFGNYGDKAQLEFARQFGNESHPTYVFLAWENNKPIAIGACIETYFSFNVYGICWVGVLEEHRNKGVCRKLFDHIEHFIRSDLLQHKTGTIILTADNSVSLYEKMGYIKQPHIIYDGSFLMTKTIN